MEKCKLLVPGYLNAMSSHEVVDYQLPILSTEVKLMQKYNSELAPVYDSKLNELYQMCVDRMK